MVLGAKQIEEYNGSFRAVHTQDFEYLAAKLDRQGIKAETVVSILQKLQIAVPSWALGTGGTRFGRFSEGGEPRSLEEKLADINLLNTLMQCCQRVSLHIPWDDPTDRQHIKLLMQDLGLKADAVNSNTFQNQAGQKWSYKFGSLSNTDADVRRQAIEHNQYVIELGEALGSKALTVWLADGSNFPGQHDFRQAFRHTLDSLEQIYKALPTDWQLLLEYKPYEPNFYATTVPDWGTSFVMVSQLGSKAKTLVDLGHHLPNTNIEQIVAILQLQNRLGGFHFNDSKYGDDDLTVGSVKPYQLFLIFLELIKGYRSGAPEAAYMIDASHNTKDPLEDLIQSLEAIQVAYARALLVNLSQLNSAQQEHDTAGAQQLLQEAFCTDVRPLVQEARLRKGGALQPLLSYRQAGIRKTLIAQRGSRTTASGL